MISSLKSKFKSSARRILFIGSDKLIVYHWSKDSLGSSYLFDTSTEGFEFFGKYLNEVNNDPVYVLLDTAAEEYRLDTIPHVFGVDRKALIERKRDKLFRGMSYFYADVQDREESGRRDDNIMLSAITDPEVIQSWLKILGNHKVPVAGVISIPLLLQETSNSIPGMQGNALVFSLQSISGLRQSFFRAGLLKFSRLVKMPRYGIEPYAPILTDELVKVRRYIEGAHFLDPDKSLDIYFLGNKELLDELGKTHTNSSMIRYHMLDVDHLLKTYGFFEQIKTPFSDKYFTYLLFKHKSKNYYAMSKETRYFQMWRINKSLRVASFISMISGIIWAGLNVFDGFTYRHQQISDAKKADFYSVRYDIEREGIFALPVDPADLKIAIETKDVLKKYKASPVDMFKLISKGLNILPEIKISQIQWASNSNPNYKIGSSGLGNVVDKEGDRPNVNDTETDYIYYQIAMINAFLTNFDGDYRKALNTIDKFSETMRQLDSVHDVSVVTLPLEISSDASLQGSANRNTSKSNFAVRIVLGVKDDA